MIVGINNKNPKDTNVVRAFHWYYFMFFSKIIYQKAMEFVFNFSCTKTTNTDIYKCRCIYNKACHKHKVRLTISY